jgi:hypothetical protein
LQQKGRHEVAFPPTNPLSQQLRSAIQKNETRRPIAGADDVAVRILERTAGDDDGFSARFRQLRAASSHGLRPSSSSGCPAFIFATFAFG